MELSLDVGQLFKNLAGRPEQHLEREQEHKLCSTSCKDLRALYPAAGSAIHVGYLTPPGLHVEHVSRVMLQGDDLSKRHVLVEELRTKAEVCIQHL